MALPEVFTVPEVAEKLKISERSLRREIAAGRLKVFRARPGHNSKILIREDELLRWLDEFASQRQFVRRGSSSERRQA